MKHISEQQVDDIIKLKFGHLVTEIGHTSFVSDKILGQIYKISGSLIRKLYMARFEEHKYKHMTLLQKLQTK